MKRCRPLGRKVTAMSVGHRAFRRYLHRWWLINKLSDLCPGEGFHRYVYRQAKAIL